MCVFFKKNKKSSSVCVYVRGFCVAAPQDNYLIALLNKGVLPLRVPLPRWPPPCFTSFLAGFAASNDRPAAAAHGYRRAGAPSNGGGNGKGSSPAFLAASVGGTQYGELADDVVLGGWGVLSRRSYLTKTLEWALHLCVFDQMLNNKDFKV